MTRSFRPFERFIANARLGARSARHRITTRRKRPAQGAARRILVAHHLLLGDTVMLIPLLAKLRETHPDAELVMALPAAQEALFAANPYRVRTVAWHPRDPSASALWNDAGYDLAYVPGDNRMSWIAYALGARWIVAFAGDSPAYKNWPIDEFKSYPSIPAAWSDMVAGLADGPAPTPFPVGRWPLPGAPALELPQPSYAVIHVGASTPLKQWQAERWNALAQWLAARDIEPVWSAGPGEEPLVERCDPGRRYRSYAGLLSLPQLARLLAGAELVVSPDTGVAHLGRLYGVKTVTLFGPGSTLISGPGEFWRHSPWRAVTVDPFPCRDQTILFKRDIAWVRKCGRTLDECAHPRCMDAILSSAVVDAIVDLGVVRS